MFKYLKCNDDKKSFFKMLELLSLLNWIGILIFPLLIRALVQPVKLYLEPVSFYEISFPEAVPFLYKCAIHLWMECFCHIWAILQIFLGIYQKYKHQKWAHRAVDATLAVSCKSLVHCWNFDSPSLFLSMLP